MYRCKKRTLILMVLPIFLITLTAAPALAQDMDESPDMLIIILDFCIARPAGLLVTAFGAAFVMVSLPITAITQDHEKMIRIFVIEPGEFTFIRPLGEF